MQKNSSTPSETNSDSLTRLEWCIIAFIFMSISIAVYVSLDPERSLNEASNAHRYSDISAILDSILDYNYDAGEYPDSIQALEYELAYEIGLCSEDATCDAVNVHESCINLSELGDLPVDPEDGDPHHSGYYMIAHENDEITVGVCSPDSEGLNGAGSIMPINVRD